jgi:5-methylcytosine-specific restriction endonuclease McrA
VPLGRLEEQICELAGHLAAATCRFLVLLGDFDERQGWAAWDMPSCAAWLSWKCQLSSGTAREHVRVARAIRGLPVIRGEFAAGRLSYAKARALTRIATPETEAGLAELAGPMTANQLERFARAHRTVTSADDAAARVRRRLAYRLEEDGSLSVTLHLPPLDGAVLLQALRAANNDLEHPHERLEHPHKHEDTAAQAGVPASPAVSAETSRAQAPACSSLADALVAVAESFLSGKAATAANPDVYQVIVHVSADALADGTAADGTAAAGGNPQAAGVPGGVPAETGVPGGVPAETGVPGGVPAETGVPGGVPAETGVPGGVPAETGVPGGVPATPPGPAGPGRCHVEDGLAISVTTAQMITCEATLSWMRHDRDGTLLDVGRRRRRPGAALRRAARERDNCRCRFPGCESRRVDLHHIQYWRNGGRTSLKNLVSLCRRHHQLVHDRGYIIAAAPAGGFTFTRPDGTTVPASPALPGTGATITGCHDAGITPETIIPAWYGERLDLDYAIATCFANAANREHAQAA